MLPSELLNKGWYRFALAITRQGMQVHPSHEEAYLFSIDGAVQASYCQFGITIEQRARMYYAIRAVIGQGDVKNWESLSTTTQDEVVAVVKKAEDFVMNLEF